MSQVLNRVKLLAGFAIYKIFELDRKLHFCSECGIEKTDPLTGKGKAWFSPVARRPRYGLGLTPTEDYPVVETERCSTCGAVLREERKSVRDKANESGE